jgi:T5SS/PEP-CTERM-associated repeat protein
MFMGIVVENSLWRLCHTGAREAFQTNVADCPRLPSLTSLEGEAFHFVGTVVGRMVLVALAALFLASPVLGDIEGSGDVIPYDPSTWDQDTNAYIGRTGSGTLSIDDGSGLEIFRGQLGTYPGALGFVTVDGVGSSWASRDSFRIGGGANGGGTGTLIVTNGGTISSVVGYVGSGESATGIVDISDTGSVWTNAEDVMLGSNSGVASLAISDDGMVSVGGTVWVGFDHGSSGTINMDNGLLVTGTLASGLDDLVGTGTINTGGLVSDVDLVFDVTRGLSQVLTINANPGQDITVNLDVAGDTIMGAGYRGVGSVSIADGVTVQSSEGYIGYHLGSTGVVTIGDDGSTWRVSDDLYVGYEGNGALNISNRGVLESAEGYIARRDGSTGTVTVDGAGSTWTNSGDLFVGGGLSSYYGSGDATLHITNGGIVSNVSGYVSSGVVAVDGTGSTWASSEDLFVGYIGPADSTVNITNGGSLTSGDGYLGRNGHGTVIVDGAGSTWNAGEINVGYGSTGTLRIIGGGVVTSVLGCTGGISSSYGSPGNVIVDGVGSRWMNAGHLMLGIGYPNYGPQSMLDIANGGLVSNASGYVAYGRSVVVATVDGAGSTWVNTGTLTIGRDGDGTLNVVNGGTVTSASGTIGDAIGTVRVEGAGSTWTNTFDLIIGNASDYSGYGTMNIIDGGQVSNRNGIIANHVDGRGDVVVDGVGSTWTNSGDLTVGGAGEGTLVISNGGRVDVGGQVWVSSNSGIHFDGGTLSVNTFCMEMDQLTGTGVIATHGLISDRDITFSSAGDLMQVIMYDSLPDQDIAVHLAIDGQGAIGAGRQGSGSITIAGGVAVLSTDGYVGYESGSTGGVTVDGAGSAWINSNDLYVGHEGNGAMNITDGGLASGTNGYIGFMPGKTGAVTVDGTGSSWTNTGDLEIGYHGEGTLDITDGGYVISQMGNIGHVAGSLGLATVDGDGSAWGNSGDISVGRYGVGRLVITNRGQVSVGGTLTIDYDGGGSSFLDMSTGGTLALYGQGSDSLADLYGLVAGADSIRYWQGSVSDWSPLSGAIYGIDYSLDYKATGDMAGYTVLTVDTLHGVVANGGIDANASEIHVGVSGHGTLSIGDGGQLSCYASGYVGYSTGSMGEATVHGAGSSWTAGSLHIGYFGDGTLELIDGGTVTSSDTIIGQYATGAVTVTGAGSEWINHNDIVIGGDSAQGAGNGTLTINNGGTVTNGRTLIASFSGSMGEVTVDGVGSAWTSSTQIHVGESGMGTVTVANGAHMLSGSGMVGVNGGSMGIVTVGDVGSIWTSDSLFVGLFGGATLAITDGGLVKVGGPFYIDWDANGDGFVNMSRGGELALYGQADASLASFYGLVGGTDAIRYWDRDLLDWSFLAGAVAGQDYWLDYHATGDLAGYTVLTVGMRLGDFSGDQRIDATDINMLFRNLGGSDMTFDLTGDGVVDQGDIDDWVFNIVPIGENIGTVYGDFNLDGEVNAGDLALLATTYGIAGDWGWATGDANGDGLVDAGDLALLASNYGTIVHPIPEPATMSLLALGGVALLRRRRQA